MKPSFIKTIRDQHGTDRFSKRRPERKQALDPRVAYLVENMMEEVLRSGTGAGVRAARLQAAGRRQNRHVARRLVRRIHFEADLRGVGGLRR